MKKKTRPLLEIEWDTCWMAIRYAMNRQTIASSTLPNDIVKAYYNRFSKEQKRMIVEDLEKNFEQHNVFGNKDIDNPIWIKFWKALDEREHYQAKLITNEKMIVFNANGRIYSLETYINNPYQESFINQEYIK